MKVLTWLNGKKSLIGSAVAVVYVGAVAQGIVERNDAVEWFITIVLGAGLAHKAYKA